ncbi:hypothetical protein ACSQ67_000460 [Phaseolus vulgaris]
MYTLKGTKLGLSLRSKEEAQKEEVHVVEREDGSGSGQTQTGLGNINITDLESRPMTKSFEKEGTQRFCLLAEPKVDAIGLGASCTGCAISVCSDDKAVSVERLTKTTQCQCEFKGLSELDVSKSYRRRSIKLSNKLSLHTKSSQSRKGMSSVSLSDGDIDNCNLRLRDPESLVESTKL